MFQVSNCIRRVFKRHSKERLMCQVCNFQLEIMDNLDLSIFNHVVSQIHQDNLHQEEQISSFEQIIYGNLDSICIKNKGMAPANVMNKNRNQQLKRLLYHLI